MLQLLLFSCTSVPEIPDDMPQSVILKTGQSELYFKRWDRALHYYRTFLERYPDDPNQVVAVEYEIAYIHYLRDDWDSAKVLFNKILSRYESESDLPLWPRILSERVLGIIETAEQEEAEKKAAKKAKRKKEQEA